MRFDGWVLEIWVEPPMGSAAESKVLRIGLDPQQIAILKLPPPPLGGNWGAESDYRIALERRESLARMIGATMAGSILEALEPR